jgi:regulator of protease activity HflC (stomatin/prohibitin superfamily)
LRTTAESIIRSAAGKLELDDIQSSRQQMNDEILKNLREAAEVWGLEITRSEITDVRVDEATKQAQRQQLNAERERRATVAKAEGERQRVELEADAQLYEATKQAEAIKLTADAEAYAVVKKAEADAEQTKVIAEAISNNGQPAIDFEILKRQVDAIGKLASSSNAKTIVLPTDVTKTVGGLATLQGALSREGRN